MERYEKLLIAARYYLIGRKFFTALTALEIGAEIHTGFRKDGITPEFMHQIQIFQYLRTLEPSLMYPEDTYIAALLHDTKEDYAHLSHVVDEVGFPPRAAKAINLLNKNGKSEEGYYDGVFSCPIASIMKCADRAHNMSTMTGVFTPEKQIRYMTEVEKYFMPGIKACRREFPYQEPAYENVKHVLNIQLDLLQVINKCEK